MLFEILQKLNLRETLDRRLVLLSDVIMVFIASLCSITFVGIIAKHVYTLSYVLIWIGASAIIALITFMCMKTYHSVVRHSSLYEIWKLAMAVTLKSVIQAAVVASVHLHIGYSTHHLLALIIVDGLTALVLLTMERAVVVACYDVIRIRAQRRRRLPTVLVFGKDENAVNFVNNFGKQYNTAGFLVRGKNKNKQHFHDLPLFEFSEYARLSRIIDMNSINAIVFSNQEDLTNEDEDLIHYCQENSIKTLYAPAVKEITGSSIKNRGVREIRIEDLLGRNEIELTSEEVANNFRNKVIMVTGAAGSIGSELCRQLATFGIKKLICFDNAETPMHNLRLELEETFPDLDFTPIIGDIRMPRRLEWAMQEHTPEIVFHAGAYKHVPLMETNPCEAVLANVTGSRNVADACVKYNVEKMIMISTDKAVNPTNIMGCTKRIAEIYVQSLGLAIAQGKVEGKTKFVTTRFGNVLGSNGSVIPRFTEQIAKGGPVTVTHPEITRFFMTIPEACRLVMEAATRGDDNQIFVFDMGKSVKIADMARRMIKLAGFVPDKDIKIEYTGLRPGEKLYEEVLSNEENTIPTEHKSIRIAKVRQYDHVEALKAVEKLTEMARSISIEDMVFLMKHVVPEFKSKNSRFEVLDKRIEDEIIQNVKN